MNVKRSISLYRIIVLLFIISSFPALTILLGLKIFCNESFYSVYLGAYTVCNLSFVFLETFLLLIQLFMSFITNKNIKTVTNTFDINLEDNESVIKNYNKYSIEYYYLAPVSIQIILGLLSHFEVYKECSTGLFFIIVIGIIQLFFGLVVFYYYIQYVLFLEKNKLKKAPRRR